MRERLTYLLEKSSSLYFNYPVAAVLELNDGTLIDGVNIETSSPAAGICAERNALFSAMTKGYRKEDFKAIHLMAKTGETIYPCFICRQALSDYCDKNLPVIVYTKQGEVTITLDKLCTYPFSSEDLNA